MGPVLEGGAAGLKRRARRRLPMMRSRPKHSEASAAPSSRSSRGGHRSYAQSHPLADPLFLDRLDRVVLSEIQVFGGQ